MPQKRPTGAKTRRSRAARMSGHVAVTVHVAYEKLSGKEIDELLKWSRMQILRSLREEEVTIVDMRTIIDVEEVMTTVKRYTIAEKR